MKKVTRTQDCPVTFFMILFMTRPVLCAFRLAADKGRSWSRGRRGRLYPAAELKNRCLREETAERVTHHSFMVLINMIRAFLWEGESLSQH